MNTSRTLRLFLFATALSHHLAATELTVASHSPRLTTQATDPYQKSKCARCSNYTFALMGISTPYREEIYHVPGYDTPIASNCDCYCPLPLFWPWDGPFHSCRCYCPLKANCGHGRSFVVREAVPHDCRRCTDGLRHNKRRFTLTLATLLTCNAIVSLFGAYTSQEAFSLSSLCSNPHLDNVGPNDTYANQTFYIPSAQQPLDTRAFLLDFHQKLQKAEQQGYLPATGYNAWPHGCIGNTLPPDTQTTTTQDVQMCDKEFCLSVGGTVYVPNTLQAGTKVEFQGCVHRKVPCSIFVEESTTSQNTQRDPATYNNITIVNSRHRIAASNSSINVSSNAADALEAQREALIQRLVQVAEILGSCYSAYQALDVFILYHLPLHRLPMTMRLWYGFLGLPNHKLVPAGLGIWYLADILNLDIKLISLIPLRIDFPSLDIWMLNLCRLNAKKLLPALEETSAICEEVERNKAFAQLLYQNFTAFHERAALCAPRPNIFDPLLPNATLIKDGINSNNSLFYCDFQAYQQELDRNFKTDVTKFSLGTLTALLLPIGIAAMLRNLSILRDPMADAMGRVLAPEGRPVDNRVIELMQIRRCLAIIPFLGWTTIVIWGIASRF